MIKEYGYELTFKRLLCDRSGKRGKRISVIGARDYRHNLISPMTFEGYTDKIVFMAYLEQVLLPCLKEGHVIIMDNASFHKGDEVKKLIESKGCILKYLPTYSPDLNPIEKKWAQIKAWFRKLTYRYSDKEELIERLLKWDKSYQLFC